MAGIKRQAGGPPKRGPGGAKGKAPGKGAPAKGSVEKKGAARFGRGRSAGRDGDGAPPRASKAAFLDRQEAREGKARASDGLTTLGKTVSDSAATIDDKLGAQYGDYARSAARTLQNTAAKLDAKDLNELGDDAREFVRKSPAAAVGIAAVAGFFLAKLFRGRSGD